MRLYYFEWLDDNELQRMLKENFVAKFKVLS
jgi:hypothetical protein